MNIITRNHGTDTTISQLTTIASARYKMRKRSELVCVKYPQITHVQENRNGVRLHGQNT